MSGDIENSPSINQLTCNPEKVYEIYPLLNDRQAMIGVLERLEAELSQIPSSLDISEFEKIYGADAYSKYHNAILAGHRNLIQEQALALIILSRDRDIEVAEKAEIVFCLHHYRWVMKLANIKYRQYLRFSDNYDKEKIMQANELLTAGYRGLKRGMELYDYELINPKTNKPYSVSGFVRWHIESQIDSQLSNLGWVQAVSRGEVQRDSSRMNPNWRFPKGISLSDPVYNNPDSDMSLEDYLGESDTYNEGDQSRLIDKIRGGYLVCLADYCTQEDVEIAMQIFDLRFGEESYSRSEIIQMISNTKNGTYKQKVKKFYDMLDIFLRLSNTRELANKLRG